MRTHLVKLSIAVSILAFGFLLPDIKQRVSKAVESYIDSHGFSGTILVAHDGQPIYHQSFGRSASPAPNMLENDFHYSIASVTKLFTSIRVLQLVDEDKIELDRPVTDYLTKFKADISNTVTVHHLLLHISGLPQYEDVDNNQQRSPESLVNEILSKGTPSEQNQFRYNNLDYLILGLLIEDVTGVSWQANIRESILEPLGMDETGFLIYRHYPADFAYSSSTTPSGLNQDPLLRIENFFSSGSMYSTTSDLLKLDQALYTDTLLSQTSRSRLGKSYPEYNYAGYGVWNYNYPFVQSQPAIMERRGKIYGANVVLVRLVDDNYSIIILSNDDRFNPDSFGDPENLREMLIRAIYHE